jgi:hypothetical protein
MPDLIIDPTTGRPTGITGIIIIAIVIPIITGASIGIATLGRLEDLEPAQFFQRETR